jgi:hypothetical protein
MFPFSRASCVRSSLVFLPVFRRAPFGVVYEKRAAAGRAGAGLIQLSAAVGFWLFKPSWNL